MDDFFVKLKSSLEKLAKMDISTPFDRTECNGFIISTVYTPDHGMETAIISNCGTSPVERYVNLEQAKIGHEKWVAFIECGGRKIVKIGDGGLVEDEELELEE